MGMFSGCRGTQDLPTSSPDRVGILLRQWWKEGTAAGNVGDWYDNRDDGHSDLDTTSWPQLRRVVYSWADILQHRNYGPQTTVLPVVVFGNSSTADEPSRGGSNPNYYYLSWNEGVSFLERQYRANNLYVYPEHHDHDPGHNGSPDGYGDLFATNTPYLIIAQGSSRSDQPFIHALPNVLAAFHPDVKKTLVENGMLMPTIQWLLRTTNRELADPSAYLTGRAHPTVFDGRNIDEVALVQKAHALTRETIPPLVRLRVIEEQEPRPGVDYFDPGLTERLADSSSVIARVFRGRARVRRLVVSAEDSWDLNHQPLTFRWVVLRGAEDEIGIAPQNEAGSIAELLIGWQPRRPTAAHSPLESNRVDIGVFASNGVNYSPPAFVTLLTLDNEIRRYDSRGRLAEIVYHQGNFTDPRLTYPKRWRDLYHYDAQGRCVGWTRYQGNEQHAFNFDGNLVVATDALGRTAQARRGRYEQAPYSGAGSNPNDLTFVPGDEVVTYAFAGDDDVIGHVSATLRDPAK